MSMIDPGPDGTEPSLHGLRAEALTPVSRLSTVVRDRDDVNVIALEEIHDLVRESGYGESPDAQRFRNSVHEPSTHRPSGNSVHHRSDGVDEHRSETSSVPLVVPGGLQQFVLGLWLKPNATTHPSARRSVTRRCATSQSSADDSPERTRTARCSISASQSPESISGAGCGSGRRAINATTSSFNSSSGRAKTCCKSADVRDPTPSGYTRVRLAPPQPPTAGEA